MSKQQNFRVRFQWPSLDSRLSKDKRLLRIAARDALFFSFASNTLLTVAWIAATIAGFNCYFRQTYRDVTIIGLAMMGIFAVVLAIRLFMSVAETANALLDDPMSGKDITRRVVWIAVIAPFSFFAAALFIITASTVLQSSEYCIIMKRSIWSADDAVL